MKRTMSDSEDDGAFASAGEGDDIPVSHTSKKGQLTPQTSSGKNDNKTSKGKNKKNQQKKKGKMAKSTDEEIVDKFMNSFESSDSTISSEMTTPQVDNVQLPKSDMEDVRITDESDDNRMKSNFSEEDDQSDVLQDCNLKRLSLSLDNKEENNKETLPDKNTATKENQEKSGKTSSWGWGSWGSSFIGAAASSVSTFTSQIGDGVNTIIDTVETGLTSVPSPEEMAKEAKEMENLPEAKEKEGKKPEDKTETLPPEEHPDVREGEEGEGSKSENHGIGGWLSGWGVSKITGAVQEKSKNIVTGSLDVLESLGRKTFDAINEHDPVGIRDKTKMLFERGDSPQLADLLKEAKEKSEMEEKIAQETTEALKFDFGALFEDYQGQAHMDALRLLSQQSEAKLSALLEYHSSNAGKEEEEEDMKNELLKVRDAFEVAIEDEEDFDKDHLFVGLVTEHLSDVHLGAQPDKLNKCQANARQWITEFFETHSTDEEKKAADPKEIYTVAIQSMAELTAKIIEQFHKAGELILLQSDVERSVEDRAKNLASLTKIFWTEINILSTKFAKCLNTVIAEEESEKKSVNQYITNVYLEASNSSSYIDEGFRALLPIMQLALLEKSSAS
ncbi:protein FAM114A2 isoform X1 [Octopus sinensis]|uniref:Protein FAM114A2 isoform X1 n=2 Tax=Octopus sinensis TaxID=2607531 RepID=A0A7E6FBC5_9MOLL|nr:protein FAM114A2 isoform X1 [Octopus sinensis]XP_036364262.1 protein FAM114A2 isoform X1 [Octopus sinensis]XP_036364263.1 protein FAM114A2 isoform X1 [Octopus sinensis]